MKLSPCDRSPLHQLVGILVLTVLSLIMAGHNAVAGSGRGTIGFGFGSSANCLSGDAPSTQLFQSLCSHVWRTDGGASSNQQLIGRWSMDKGTRLVSVVFYANGRYEKSSQVAYDGKVYNFEQEGKYWLQGNELVLTPDNTNSPTKRGQIGWHEERNQSGWIRRFTFVGELPGTPGNPYDPTMPFEEHYYYEGQR